MTETIYKNPASTIDVIINYQNQGYVLIRRSQKEGDPNSLKWALPGGFINYGAENLEQAAVREIKEETNLDIAVSPKDQFRVYSDPDRDPRGHIITTVFHVDIDIGDLKASDDAIDIGVFRLDNLPGPLAFDHEKILTDYKEFINSCRKETK